MHIPSLVAIHQETKEKSCINCGTHTHTDGLTDTRRKPSSRVAYPATKNRKELFVIVFTGAPEQVNNDVTILIQSVCFVLIARRVLIGN